MTSREKRKELIEKIEKKRNSKLIVYVTSDRPRLEAQIAGDTISIIHEHILGIDPINRKNLDLFIYSRGGDSDIPWAIVSMFREYLGNDGSFNVLIPYRAHSAATIIALGADEIIMTKKAELGPIDATMVSGDYNPKDISNNQTLSVPVEDVMGYFNLMGKIGCERPDEKMQGFKFISDKLHPLALGKVNRILEETRLVAFRLLSTRSKPFMEDKNHEIIKKLSSEAYSHRHAICRTEAKKYIGLDQVRDAEDANIADELWDLYKEYRELFEFENPFKPEEPIIIIINRMDEWMWAGLKQACIESLVRLDIFEKNLKVKKLKNVPPQVNINLNLSGINLPAINLAGLPPEITPDMVNTLISQTINQTVQNILNQTVQQTVNQVISTMPDAGFQYSEFDTGWKTEN